MNFWYNYKHKQFSQEFINYSLSGLLTELHELATTLYIIKHPQLVKCFNIEQLKSDSIAYILIHHPQLSPFFTLQKLDEDDIAWVLQEQPQFQNLFPDSNV